MATKNHPGEFDCYDNAEPDEPMFVLLARDVTAPLVIGQWINRRLATGANQPDDPQILEAVECAKNMMIWRGENRSDADHT